MPRRNIVKCWRDVGEIKKREAQIIVSLVIDELLNDVDKYVSGKWNGNSSACSIIPSTLSDSVLNKSHGINYDEIEDRRLNNWNKWIKIREKESKKIAKFTLRNKSECLLNSNPNNYRNVLKQKEIIDKLRNRKGDEEFWKLPEISARGLYTTLPKPKDLREVQIDYTQTPDAILREQNISITKHYRTEIYLKLLSDQKNMLKIHKRDPRMERLAIAKNCESMLKSKSSLESFKIPADNASIDDRKQILIVNGTNLNDENVLIKMSFKTFENEYQIKFITLKNAGDIAIDCYFEKCIMPDEIYLPKNIPQTFFFDKCSFRIVPGEEIKLNFSFYAKKRGYYLEDWLLNCKPACKNGHFVKIKLSGICKENCVMDYSIPLSKKPVLSIDPIEVEFRKNNPNFNYHPEIVEKLHQLHDEINESECEWNYNIDSLYNAILKHGDREKQNKIFNKFNKLVEDLMTKKRALKNQADDHKYPLVRNIICLFIERLEAEMENSGGDLTNQFSSIKTHFVKSLNKIVAILEAQ
jgi:hypothetical protein